MNLTLQQNINSLVVLNRTSYGFDTALIQGMNLETLPPPWQATIVIALYSLLFFGYTYYGLVRRDIGGAA